MTHHPVKRRVAVLISGRGSNMASLIAAAREPDYPAEIVLVISSRRDAAGLAIAAQAGIATAVIEHRGYPDRASFDDAIGRELAAHGVEIVCLAGFMRLLTPGFVDAWTGRMINIHPSLLPDYKGLKTHARALAAGETRHGCTVHYVVPALDSGPTIAQAEVPVLPDDTEESLGARVLEAEHTLYPEALSRIALSLPTRA